MAHLRRRDRARGTGTGASPDLSGLPDRLLPVRFDRGSLRLDAPQTLEVPAYLRWDPRVRAWRTEAINHLRFREDAAACHLGLHDEAECFFDCPTLRLNLPPLRPDQDAAVVAWERAGCRGVIVKPTGTGKTRPMGMPSRR